MRKLMIVCVAALFVVGLVASAEAAVQNVKVSGGITARGIVHDDFDLDANDDITAGSPGSDGTDSHYMSTVKVNVDADLTDNVSAQIQLLNQRDWAQTGAAGRGNRGGLGQQAAWEHRPRRTPAGAIAPGRGLSGGSRRDPGRRAAKCGSCAPASCVCPEADDCTSSPRPEGGRRALPEASETTHR